MAKAVPRRAAIRAVAVGAMLVLALGALGYRLVRLQVTEAPTWQARALAQQRPVNQVPAYRGDIRSADGVVLARSVRTRSAFAEPRRLGRWVREGRTRRQLPPEPEDYRDAARRIASALDYDARAEHTLFERLRNPRTQGFCWIERRLDDESAARLESLGIPGLGFKTEYRRAYPGGSLAAHLLGFTRLTGEGELEGATGVEAAFEPHLRGSPGRREVLRDGTGRLLLSEGNLLRAPRDGATVELTIDSRIQAIAERAAVHGAEIWDPEGVSIVCLDPRDGRVLALASLPTYDPEDLGALNPASDAFRRAIRNRPLMDPYEPGSTLKAFVAAAALERGAVRPDQHIDCTGPYVVAGKAVTDVTPHGVLSFQEVISRSSNVGMVKIALALGPEATLDVLVRAGLGAPTGLGITPEEGGRLPALGAWRTHTTRSVAQGYALMATPLQMASAFAAFAAGGLRHEPQLLQSVRDHRGDTVQRFQPRPAARIVDEALCREVLVPALVDVVETGTARGARLSRWSMAGKTGTARKVEGGRYVNRYRSSFIGFAPAEDPRLLVLVMVDDPRSPDGRRPYGGTVAGPIVQEIFEEALPYLRVPPSPGHAGDEEAPTPVEDGAAAARELRRSGPTEAAGDG